MVLPARPGPMANQTLGLPVRSMALTGATTLGCRAEVGGKPTGTSSSPSRRAVRLNRRMLSLDLVAMSVGPYLILAGPNVCRSGGSLAASFGSVIGVSSAAGLFAFAAV